MINQREIGQDVRDFEIGMKHAVREDRTLFLWVRCGTRAFMTAIHAAETGHFSEQFTHPALQQLSAVFWTCFPCTVPFARQLHFYMKASWHKTAQSINLGWGVYHRGNHDITPMIQKLVLEGEDSKLPDAIRMGPGRAQGYDEPKAVGR